MFDYENFRKQFNELSSIVSTYIDLENSLVSFDSSDEVLVEIDVGKHSYDYESKLFPIEWLESKEVFNAKWEERYKFELEEAEKKRVTQEDIYQGIRDARQIKRLHELREKYKDGTMAALKMYDNNAEMVRVELKTLNILEERYPNA